MSPFLPLPVSSPLASPSFLIFTHQFHYHTPTHPHFPWEIHENHDYLHVHYHNFGDDYNWDYDYKNQHLTNHVPSNIFLNYIENLYLRNNIVHIHIHYHWDDEQNFSASLFEENDGEGE